MRIPCPGRPACDLGVQAHVHHSNGMVELQQPATSRYLVFPADLPVRAPRAVAADIERRLIALESMAHPQVNLQPGVSTLVEQHPLVRELRAKVEEQRGQIAELEHKVGELWRRSM